MRSLLTKSRGPLGRIGYLLAVLGLNAWLGGCYPQDASETSSSLARSVSVPPSQMTEILGHLLVALCLTAFLGGRRSGGSGRGKVPYSGRLGRLGRLGLAGPHAADGLPDAAV